MYCYRMVLLSLVPLKCWWYRDELKDKAKTATWHEAHLELDYCNTEESLI